MQDIPESLARNRVTFDSAAAAESAFYAAFSSGDHLGMMEVWASDDEIVCVHPMGPRLTGRDLISASWVQILAGEPHRTFDIQLVTNWTDAELAVRVVNEIISLPTSKLEFTPVLATNVYRSSRNGWHIVEHHASIDASRNLGGPADSDEGHTRH